MPIVPPFDIPGLGRPKSPRAISEDKRLLWDNGAPTTMGPEETDRFVSSIKTKALAGGVMDIVGSLPKSILRKVLPERFVNSAWLLPARLGLFAASFGLFYSIYKDLDRLRYAFKSDSHEHHL